MTAVGMIGGGRWGGNWVRTLAGLGGVELRYCCDLSQASLARVARQFPHVRTTTRVEDLIEDPTLDAVVIATIAPTHYDVARRALEAGKHVMVEKPMTLTTADAVALNDVAQRCGKVLMVGHLLEYHPAVRFIKGMIDTGELGEVHYVYSQRLNLGSVRADENAWWSLAPHDISVACRLLDGCPTSVQCRGQNVVQPKIADVVFGTLEYPGGRLAHVHVSWLDPHKTRKLTVVGSRRMVVFDDTLPGYQVTVYDKGFRLNQDVNSYADWITMRQGDVVMPKLEPGEPLALEAQHFVDCVRTGKRPVSDGTSGAMVVAVLEHGQRSLEQGGSVVPIPAAVAPAPLVRKAA
jgi:predicted dehydrogenase